MHHIKIEAPNIEALNQKLGSQKATSSIRIDYRTHNFEVCAWILQSRNQPSCRVNGIKPLMIPINTSNETNSPSYFLLPVNIEKTKQKSQSIEVKLNSFTQDEHFQITAVDRTSIIYLLQITRPDLQLDSASSIYSWLITSGFDEMNLLHQDAAIISNLNQLDEETGRTNFQTSIWEQRDDLQAALKNITSPLFSDWLTNHGNQEYKLLTEVNKHPSTLLPQHLKYRQRSFGVNLIGYASSVIGIGEDLRTCREALESIGIPIAIIDIPTQHTSHELREQARTEADQLAPYAINLICMTAEEHARIFLELGYAIFSERYNIGYWPWELENWPDPWKPLLSLVDEVWASSRHTHQSIQQELTHRPQPKLTYCPLGVSPIAPLTPEQKAKARDKHWLPREAMLMTCSFDGRSSFFRKNPWGAIDAFLKAFPKNNGADVGLVIKTIHAGVDTIEWDKLKELIKHDDRIIVIDGALDRDELIQLYGCCDVLVSLHRAEGFGRILAECLLLGLDVVATNYSGNTDFCRGQHAHPVDYDLTEVQDGDYPHHHNQQWAEPCCSHAAEILRNIYAKRSTQQYAHTQERKATIRSYQKQLFTYSIAKHYGNQLRSIWNQSRNKNAEQLNLRWSRQQCLYGIEES